MAVGLFAGTLSTFGFGWLAGVLEQKLNLGDTCGVHVSSVWIFVFWRRGWQSVQWMGGVCKSFFSQLCSSCAYGLMLAVLLARWLAVRFPDALPS